MTGWLGGRLPRACRRGLGANSGAGTGLGTSSGVRIGREVPGAGAERIGKYVERAGAGPGAGMAGCMETGEDAKRTGEAAKGDGAGAGKGGCMLRGAGTGGVRTAVPKPVKSGRVYCVVLVTAMTKGISSDGKGDPVRDSKMSLADSNNVPSH